MDRTNYIILIPFLSVLFTSCDKGYNTDEKAEQFIDSLISEMTLEEKIGQMTSFTSGWDVTGPVIDKNYKEDILSGRCGNLFNAHTVSYNRELQRMAVEETRLGIPLLFGYDVIHGYKTIFPIPLAEACSWNLKLIEKTARLSAMEATAAGINWTFNPMVDIVRDPRWGRIAEGAGEDPFLGSQIAIARVKGYQGSDLSSLTTMAACVKHFAAYGAAQAGRDYHTVDVSDRVLHEVYLPPFKAAVRAGAATIMTAFNEYNGIPATGNSYLLSDILRKEWEFQGVVVTDYTSINEMVTHGFSKDEKQAGEQALVAGVDMDLQGAVYRNHLMRSIEEGTLSEDLVDQSVARVLKLKYELGLFRDPFRYLDEQREKNTLFSEKIMEHALESAKRSIVLLENKKYKGRKLLPIAPDVKSIALIGALADNQLDVMGTWHASGSKDKVVSIKSGLESRFPDREILYAEGCKTWGTDNTGFERALSIARKADLVVLAMGENYEQSGEAASRSNLNLPGPQLELVKEIIKTGKPVVILIMAGRPLTIPWIADNVPGVIYAWHLGTRTGDATAAVLAGDYNPSGKLVVSFPRNVGQIPVYYSMKNTGRPYDEDNKYTSKYIDVPNDPLYPFGFGLSYTEFHYHNLEINKTEISAKDTLIVRVDITNKGKYRGEEIVQFYIRDSMGSVTRPVKELKGFVKVMLEPGENETVEFRISEADLRFYDRDMKFTSEPGEFSVFVGPNSRDCLRTRFTLLN